MLCDYTSFVTGLSVYYLQEQCIKYLVDKFAKCQVKVSEPIVPFREAVLTAPAGFKPHLSPPWREQVQENQCPSASRFWLETSSISLLFRCAPLSEACLEYMTAHPSAKARLLQVSSFHDNTIKDETATKSKEDDLASVLALLRECLAPEKNSQKGSSKITSHPVIAITPENVDYTDVLLLGLYFTVGLWKENKLLPSTKGPSTLQSSDSPDILLDSQKPLHVTFINQILTRLSSSISAGFQLCCASGPLMAEPLHGVCFVLEKMHITSQALCLSPEDFLKLTATCMDGVECVFTNLHEDVAIGLDIQTGQLISEVR